MNCHYCAEEAMSCTQPPLCARHLDLAILAEYLRDKDQPVNPESIKALMARCRDNHGSLVLTEAEVEPLMVGPFADQYVLEPPE